MQIPGMKVEAVRALMNADVREIYELAGRAPEVLFEEARQKTYDLGSEILPYFRLAVYYAESEDPDPAKLHAYVWDS